MLISNADRTRIQCRFENETMWLTQALIAELFQTTPQNVTLHLKAIFAEGNRQVSRSLRHYRLEAVLAVGYRVRNHRGTQFRQWATARLGEYLVKGFTMDDERLKNPPVKRLGVLNRNYEETRPAWWVDELLKATFNKNKNRLFVKGSL